MHVDFFRATLDRKLDGCMNVALVAVHTTLRQQADDMDGRIVLDRLVDRIGQGTVRKKRAGTDRTADACELLVDDTPGAKIQVTNLGIAHLVCRQSHRRARGGNRRVGVLAPQPVKNRRSRLRDGIVGRLLAVAPAVENQQCDGSWLCHCVLLLPLQAPIARAHDNKNQPHFTANSRIH